MSVLSEYVNHLVKAVFFQLWFYRGKPIIEQLLEMMDIGIHVQKQYIQTLTILMKNIEFLSSFHFPLHSFISFHDEVAMDYPRLSPPVVDRTYLQPGTMFIINITTFRFIDI